MSKETENLTDYISETSVVDNAFFKTPLQLLQIDGKLTCSEVDKKNVSIIPKPPLLNKALATDFSDNFHENYDLNSGQKGGDIHPDSEDPIFKTGYQKATTGGGGVCLVTSENTPPETSEYHFYDQDVIHEDTSAFSEYETWLSGLDSGNVEQRLPVDETGTSAEHTDTRPNQTTCERGSEMYLNNTSTPVDGVPPIPSIIRIDQQYLSESVAKACEQWRFLLVKSAMGTGKTTAMRAVISRLDDSENILMVTPRKKLNYALAHDLHLNYYEDVKGATDKTIRKEMARRMVVTPQSLGAIIAEFPDTHYRYIVLDESESVASMLVSDVTNSKRGTLKALKTVSANAGNVVMMDAAIGSRSKRLMQILSGDTGVGELVNTYQRWKNIQCEILAGGKYADRLESMDALQIESLKRGERIGISSSSASYCELRHEVLSALFPDLRVGLFTSKSGAEVKKILATPEKAGEYDVLIFSPAVNVGVSFDIKNHFDVVFGVYPNVQATGDSDDAIQGMARIRHPALNRWVVVLDDEKQVFKNAEVFQVPEEIKQVILNRYVRNSFYAGCPVEITTEDEEITDLWSTCRSYHVQNKNNFSEYFHASLTESGVRIVGLDYASIATDEISNQYTEDAKEAKAERKKAAKTTSPKIDEDGYQYLKAMVKFRGDEVTQEQLDSMARFRFEKKFDIDCDKLEPVQIERYLELDDDDAISQCINREIALSDDGFTKEYVKARVVGVGGSDAFKVDLIDDKLNYRLKKKLLTQASKYFDGGEYSHASLKKSGALVRFIERNHKEIILSGVIPLAKDWKDKPALVLNHLLSMCGYGHKSRRIGGKKRAYIYEAESVPAINQLCQMRFDKGLDWIAGTKRLIGLHEEILKTEEGRTRLERLWAESGRSDDMSAFLEEFRGDIVDIEAGVYPDDVMLKIVTNWR